MTAFLSSLAKAVESTPNAALVYTLAIGKVGRATDVYSAENQCVADRMAEIENVSARKATLLNPTAEDETEVVDAYSGLWAGHPGRAGRQAGPARDGGAVPGALPLHPTSWTR